MFLYNTNVFKSTDSSSKKKKRRPLQNRDPNRQTTASKTTVKSSKQITTTADDYNDNSTTNTTTASSNVGGVAIVDALVSAFRGREALLLHLVKRRCQITRATNSFAPLVVLPTNTNTSTKTSSSSFFFSFNTKKNRSNVDTKPIVSTTDGTTQTCFDELQREISTRRKVEKRVTELEMSRQTMISNNLELKVSREKSIQSVAALRAQLMMTQTIFTEVLTKVQEELLKQQEEKNSATSSTGIASPSPSSSSSSSSVKTVKAVKTVKTVKTATTEDVVLKEEETAEIIETGAESTEIKEMEKDADLTDSVEVSVPVFMVGSKRRQSPLRSSSQPISIPTMISPPSGIARALSSVTSVSLQKNHHLRHVQEDEVTRQRHRSNHSPVDMLLGTSYNERRHSLTSPSVSLNSFVIPGSHQDGGLRGLLGTTPMLPVAWGTHHPHSQQQQRRQQQPQPQQPQHHFPPPPPMTAQHPDESIRHRYLMTTTPDRLRTHRTNSHSAATVPLSPHYNTNTATPLAREQFAFRAAVESAERKITQRDTNEAVARADELFQRLKVEQEKTKQLTQKNQRLQDEQDRTSALLSWALHAVTLQAAKTSDTLRSTKSSMTSDIVRTSTRRGRNSYYQKLGLR